MSNVTNFKQTEFDEFGEPVVQQNDETYVPFQNVFDYYFNKFPWLVLDRDYFTELDFAEDNYPYYDEENESNSS